MLSRCDFDKNNNWEKNNIPQNLHAIVTRFINTSKEVVQGKNILLEDHVPTYSTTIITTYNNPK